MARRKRYLDTTVYEETKRRLHEALDITDTLTVSFSGGKDSQVCMHALREVKQERGDDSPVSAVFFDEEALPPAVIDHVNAYREMDWVDLKWICYPMVATRFVFGTSVPHLKWDPDREGEWIRPKPPWAIVPPAEMERDRFVQTTIMHHLRDRFGWHGVHGQIIGIRAAESHMRHQSVMTSLTPWRVVDQYDRTLLNFKPIYDWRTGDVLKYIHESGAPICEEYDALHLTGGKFRVSSALGSAKAKEMDRMAARDPEFVSRILEKFPDMAVQLRWWRFRDNKAAVERYGGSWDGVKQYIADFMRDNAEDAYAWVEHMQQANENWKARKGAWPPPFPPKYGLRYIMAGDFLKGPAPLYTTPPDFMKRWV